MSKIADMTTDQLKDAVEKEMKKSAPDRSTVMECLQELKRRGADGEPDKVLEAWDASRQIKTRATRISWGRIVAAAAVVAVLLLATVPQALGAESIFTRIGNWTKEIFSFGDEPEKEFVYQTDHPGLQELYDTVTSLGIENNVVPTWLPEGYELKQLSVKEEFDYTTVFASYINGTNCITISVVISVQLPYKDSEYQKNDTDVAIYEKNGINHYIISNNNSWAAVWFSDNMECSITAGTQGDLQRMVASIYKVEE